MTQQHAHVNDAQSHLAWANVNRSTQHEQKNTHIISTTRHQQPTPTQT